MTSIRRFPGANYALSPTLTAMASDRASLERETLRSTRLAAGHFGQGFDRYGVVSAVDPTSADSGDPLYVSESSVPLKADVAAGSAVTPSGHVIELTEAALGVSMAATATGSINVLYAEYTVIESTTSTDVTRSGVVAGRTFDPAEPADLIHACTLAEYTNALVFSVERKRGIVVLAVCLVVEDASAVRSLSIDLSNDTYAFNRPWFSPVDVEHRSKVGTGLVTDSNPHGLSLADLAAGEMTLLQALCRTGVMVAKDFHVDRVPGTLCRETITAARLVLDTDGSVTGVRKAYYVRLLDTPIHLGRCVDSRYSGEYWGHRDYAPWLLRGTNILVFHPMDVVDTDADVHVWYMSTGAAMDVGLNLDTLSVTQLDASREMIVSCGRPVSTLTDLGVDLSVYNRFPMMILALVLGDGSLVTLPTLVQCHIRLDGLSGYQDISGVSLLGSSRLWLYLSGATASADLNVVIEVIGTAPNGSVITESVTFDENWRDAGPPNGASALGSNGTRYAARCLQNVFSTVTSWRPVTRDNDGPLSAIGLFAMPVWALASSVREAFAVARIHWDGYRAQQVYDLRRVVTSLTESPSRHSDLMIALTLAKNGVIGEKVTHSGGESTSRENISAVIGDRELIVEDFNRPRYHGLYVPPQKAVAAASPPPMYFYEFPDLRDEDGNFIEDVYPGPDRWDDGMGWANFSYPLPVPATYLSRAIWAPTRGRRQVVGPGGSYSSANLSGYRRAKVRVFRPKEDSGSWLSDFANKRVHSAAEGGRLVVAIRFSLNTSIGGGGPLVNSPEWGEWIALTSAFSGATQNDDADTFYFEFGDTETKVLKYQFGVITGNARALSVEFYDTGDDETVYDEYSFIVDGRDPAAVSNGTLPLTEVRANAKFSATAVHLGEDPDYWATDFLGHKRAGVYQIDFTYGGDTVPAGDYEVIVVPSTREDPSYDGQVRSASPYSCSVTKETSGYAEATSHEGRLFVHLTNTLYSGLPGGVGQIQNRTRFQVTLRVPRATEV